jgi:serine/threonine-protein kinase HipA
MQHFDFNNVTSYSYEQLFQTMRLLRLPYPQAEQLFRRMVFNVMARNCDDHTKNFAFRLRKNQDWELTPAYDICHAYRPGSEWVSQHALSINGKRNNISKDDMLSIAKSMNIKKATQIIQQTSETIQNWTTFAEETKVEPKLKEAIRSTLITFK